MTYLEAFLQAVLQGLTEFLPISSSGHLSLFQHFTGNSGEAGLFFSLMLHLGTLIAVFIAFRKTIWQLILEFFTIFSDIFHGRFTLKKMSPYRNMLLMFVIACLPMILVLILKDFYTSFSEDRDILAEGIFFLITAIMLFMADHAVKGKKGEGDIRPKDALMVGVFQAIAPFPGVSRSGSTISAGLLSGMSRDTAVQFSFILGIPAVLGGSVLEIGEALSGGMEVAWGPCILGLIVSAVVGVGAIKLVSWLIKSDRFKIFVYYTAILGVIVSAIGIFEHIVGMNIVDYILQ